MDAKRYVYLGAVAAGVAAAGVALLSPVTQLGATNDVDVPASEVL